LASTLLDYDATNVAGAQAGRVNKDTVLIWGGETTVTLTLEAGLGGRSQELALAAAEVLSHSSEPRPGGCNFGVMLLAAGTDGRDGPTDAAGGFADAETWRAIRAGGRDPVSDLRTHHGYDALAAGGALFKTGMTGTNVMDLVLGLRYRMPEGPGATPPAPPLLG
jgi:hydroxypyruvate reductase